MGAQLLSSVDLFAYQKRMVELVRNTPNIFLALDMGLGKSAITLYALRLMYAIDFRRALIVAPLTVAKETWPDELSKWKEPSVLRHSLLVGSPSQRLKAVKQAVPIHIVNRENFVWLVKHWGNDWPYDLVVWDESSSLKSWKYRNKKKEEKPTPTWFGAMAHVRPKVRRMILLTGTPAPNGLIDLGGQAFILDGGQRLGRTKTQFLERWFYPDWSGYNWAAKDHAHGEIMGKLSDVMFSLRSDDYLDLPPTKIVPHYVRLSDKAMKEYRRFQRTLVSETYDIEAVSSGVLTGKLLQFASGSMYRNFEDGTREIARVHDDKIEALERIVEESAGQSILIAYGFQFDIDLIKKKYPKVVLFDDDKDFVKNWNAGKIRLGLAHPASLGHGTNLQSGGHIAVWFSLTWSLELWLQFNKRLPRLGQTAETVFIHTILARDTMDEICFERLTDKRITQDRINEAVKLEIRRAGE